MAVSKRNAASYHAQEPPLTIARVALYARVSTCNGQDPEMQLRELREYACRRGLTIANEYVDHGVSGSKESRPQLNQLMADAHQRKFDAVLVWKIDRFGRSLKHLLFLRSSHAFRAFMTLLGRRAPTRMFGPRLS